MRHAYGVLSTILIAGLAQASDPSAGLELKVDGLIHKAGPKGIVTFSVTNHLPKSQLVKHSYQWMVFQGTQMIRKQMVRSIHVLESGQTLQYPGWNKRDSFGKPVKPGSYTITVTFTRSKPGTPYVHSMSQSVLLTKSGKLAGNSLFPLAKGNEWMFVATKGIPPNVKLAPTTMNVVGKTGSWYQLRNFAAGPPPGGGDSRVQMVGTSKPKLTISKLPPPATELFHFRQSKGHTYEVKTSKATIGAVNETVVTPAGTFKGCYRIDFQSMLNVQAGSSYTFAPGIGLIQHRIHGSGEDITWSLHHAKVKDLDGKVYTVSQ